MKDLMTPLQYWRLNRMFVMYIRPLARRIPVVLENVSYLNFEQISSHVSDFANAAPDTKEFALIGVMALKLDEMRQAEEYEAHEILIELSKILSRGSAPLALSEEVEEELLWLEGRLFLGLSDA